jgi:hypothetical protein
MNARDGRQVKDTDPSQVIYHLYLGSLDIAEYVA